MQELKEVIKVLRINGTRSRDNVYKRMAFANIVLANEPNVTYSTLGKLLNRDHSSIVHYTRRHEEEMFYSDYKETYELVNQIYTDMAKQNREEERLQIQFYTYFHNTYPEYRGLLVYNLNNPRNAIDGHSAKLMGLRKSRPDMELYWKGKVYLLELKTPRTKPNQDQLDYHEKLRAEGFDVTVARTFEECVEWLDKIIG